MILKNVSASLFLKVESKCSGEYNRMKYFGFSSNMAISMWHRLLNS